MYENATARPLHDITEVAKADINVWLTKKGVENISPTLETAIIRLFRSLHM